VSRLLFLALCCLLIGPRTAGAENRSVSYSIWNVVAQSVHARFLVPDAESRHLVEPGAPLPTGQAIASYIADRVAVTSAGGPCRALDQGEEIGLVFTLVPTPGLRRFEIIFECPQPKGITLQNKVLFDRVPSHLNFARIQIGDGAAVDELFTSTHERVALPPQGAQLSGAGMVQYLRLGVSHIVGSFDRICFVLAFLLLRCRRQDIGYLVGGISLGYLLSLAITTTGVIAPRIELTEPLLGFMVLLVAVDAAAQASKHPKAAAALLGTALLVLAAITTVLHGMTDGLLLVGLAAFAACYLPISSELSGQAMSALIPATLFGTLEGFGFAATVSVLKLPLETLVPMQLGFDAGAVLVIALLASAIVTVASLLRARGHASWPLSSDLAAAALTGLGVFWFISRLYIA
jgi:HupE / UreJ protein